MIQQNIIFILYVKDQEKAKHFYQALFELKPRLDVPGMTEFDLFKGVVLGLMPEAGIVRLLEGKIPNPQEAQGIARSEVYLCVDEPEAYYHRLTKLGGTGISEVRLRDWDDYVAYGRDLDGHILAFAKKVE